MNVNILFEYVGTRVNEPYRFYHNQEHILDIYEQVKEEFPNDKEKYTLGVLFAAFHDLIYIPWEKDNETACIDFLDNTDRLINYFEFTENDLALIPKLMNLIEYTKYKWNHYTDLPLDVWDYIKMDLKGLLIPNADIYKNELAIFKEYQFVDWIVYKENRIRVLEDFKTKLDGLPNNLDARINFLNSWTPRIALFAGSFSPFTIGHRNILEKAEKIFDKVILAAGYNSDKEKSPEGLVEDIKKSVVFRQVESYDTLLTKYLDSKPYPITLVRGLRNGDDLPYEQNLANVLRDVKGEPLNMVYIICDREYEYVSSSAARTLKKFGIEGMYV